jgi:hypothetical protein
MERRWRDPDIGLSPSGCPFHPRCPLALALALAHCRVDRAHLRGRPEGGQVACHATNKGIE